MEQIGLGIPQKFTSAEEELAFLRAHIAEREKQIQTQGSETEEKAREKAVEQTIEKYQQITAKEILHEAQVMPEHEVEQVVLRLKPEPHDKQMEELFGILISRGIKNSLDVVSQMGTPHLDDDFHRFLVQYLASTGSVPGLKENNPVYKGIDMRLFEITLPDQNEKEAKSFKDFITAMEQLYMGLLNIGGPNNDLDRYFTLELALPNSGSEVLFYASVPKDKGDLFEKQVQGYYQDAKIVEVTDDYNIFVEDGAAVGSYMKLADLPIFPIKTHDAITHDPMNALVNAFSKLQHQGEGVAVQFVIKPRGQKYTHDFYNVLDQVKTGTRAKDAYSMVHGFASATKQVLKDLLFTTDKRLENKEEKQEPQKDRDIEHITEKLKSPMVEVGIRIVASAAGVERARDILRELEAVFVQFNNPGSNSLHFERVDASGIREFLHNFSFRLIREKEMSPLNLTEVSTLFHFPVGVTSTSQLKQSKATTAPLPMEMQSDGILLGYNEYRGEKRPVFMAREDRVRHMYVIGQTGTGKTVFLKNMIIQDIKNGDGVCFIDPHGSDIQDILANIPPERMDDVIYFDPAYTARPMGLNMLEYDVNYPEQKTFVVNELLAIFNKLFDMKTAGGPAFEQYFRNSALLVMEDPASGMTLLEIGRVLADKEFRDLKLSRCKNPIIRQFWENAEKTSGESSLANFVPYVTNKFDVFISNDIMRPVIAQEKSVFNFREIMDNKKILLVNLAKGRLGDINANLIGLILVGKITMAAMSRVDILGKGKINDFYLYIDEFQNITTDSIEVILSEARKYRLSLNIAHQYVEQLEENIKNAVFGNVGSMVVHRVSTENAEIFSKQFEPTFTPHDIIKLENLNCYIKMLVNGMPVKPFNSHTPFPPRGNTDFADKLKELSYLKFGRDRTEIEEEILERYLKVGA